MKHLAAIASLELTLGLKRKQAKELRASAADAGEQSSNERRAAWLDGECHDLEQALATLREDAARTLAA